MPYQAKIPITFHDLLSPAFQTCCFQGVGPRWPTCFIMEQLASLPLTTNRCSKSSYIYWCPLKTVYTIASLKQFLGPLHPSILLSSCLGLPQLWLNVDFPLHEEVPQSRWDLQRNECKSPVVLSIEKIPQGTNRGTTNFFP